MEIRSRFGIMGIRAVLCGRYEFLLLCACAGKWDRLTVSVTVRTRSQSKMEIFRVTQFSIGNSAIEFQYEGKCMLKEALCCRLVACQTVSHSAQRLPAHELDAAWDAGIKTASEKRTVMVQRQVPSTTADRKDTEARLSRFHLRPCQFGNGGSVSHKLHIWRSWHTVDYAGVQPVRRTKCALVFAPGGSAAFDPNTCSAYAASEFVSASSLYQVQRGGGISVEAEVLSVRPSSSGPCIGTCQQLT